MDWIFCQHILYYKQQYIVLIRMSTRPSAGWLLRAAEGRHLVNAINTQAYCIAKIAASSSLKIRG